VNTTELFLIALLIIFSLPWLVWRAFNTDYFAPLVVVQIVMGILLGPGVLGQWSPEAHQFVFTPAVVHALNGVAWWGVMLFVMIAGHAHAAGLLGCDGAAAVLRLDRAAGQ
jgi:hypothetical protein